MSYLSKGATIVCCYNNDRNKLQGWIIGKVIKDYNKAVEVSKPDGEATNIGVQGIVTSE